MSLAATAPGHAPAGPRRAPTLLDAASSQLLVIDMQERLLPAMDGAVRIAERTGILLQMAGELGVPVLATEQYPKGLGPTVPELRALLPERPPAAKLAFSLGAEQEVLERIHEAGRPQVLLTGVEAHVCVLQTALDLSAEGFAVYVVADAVGSRSADSKALALNRLAHAGVVLVNTEMVLFEWVDRAGTDTFRSMSRLVR